MITDNGRDSDSMVGANCQDVGDVADLFDSFPEGTRIFIDGRGVTFENMTPDLLDVALSLNGGDGDLAERAARTGAITRANGGDVKKDRNIG